MVSVIVPVYNVQKYLAECLDSICGQDYKDMEIIVVDDGSTDESGKICDQYAKRDARMRIIHQQNRGLSGARNAALEIACGDYIMFVDSDDYVTPDYVSYMVSLMEKEKEAAIGICRYYNAYEQENGTLLIKECVSRAEKHMIEGKEILPKRFGQMKVYYVIAWNKIYRKEIFANLRFPEKRICEDGWISLDLYKMPVNLICTDEQFFYYIIRNGSISNDSSEKWIRANLDWFKREIEYFRDSKNPKDVMYPAQAFVSMLFKNQKLGELKKDTEYNKCWDYVIDLLMHDDRMSLKNKVKYYIYYFGYKMSTL